MNSLLSKVLLCQNTRTFMFSAASVNSHLLNAFMPLAAFQSNRQYRSKPTHGIGRYRHLLSKELPKKKKEKIQGEEIKGATATEFGVFNVCVSGYDMTTVEHYAQYIHNLCHNLKINVKESYALPTKTTEIMLMEEHGTKMFVDAIVKTHERVIQISQLKATLFPILLEVLLKNIPEGLQLCLKQHTEADYLARFKSRPELDELIAKINQ